MAELLDSVYKLQDLPPDLHLFCPRSDADEALTCYDEDQPADEKEDEAATAERRATIEEVTKRKWLALEALQILAFDGDDAQPHKEWITSRLNTLMSSCDVCVRVFHKSRAEWKNRLVEQYDDENIVEFMQTIDNMTFERITQSLDGAKATLQPLEPKQRNVRVLPPEQMYAFFEALSCDPFIRNEELLQRHFDVPFDLVQTRKPLRLATYLPSMTRFLFQNVQRRQDWAFMSWQKQKRDLLPAEFDWAVRDYLLSAMWRVQMGNLDEAFVPLFWSGTKNIVQRLSKDIITHSIRGLEPDLYKLILDHLSLKVNDNFLDLVATIKLLIEKAPVDFWAAMDSITPSITTVVEQVLNSPILRQIFLSASAERQETLQYLDDSCSWIDPFLKSIAKPANLDAACKTFSYSFFDRFQSDQYSRVARARCFREGLKVLDYAFKKMNEGKTPQTFVGQPTVNGMLKNLSSYIDLITGSMSRLEGTQLQADLPLTLSMVKEAFTLECQSLAIERKLIEQEKPSPTELPPSKPVWEAILRAINKDNMDLATVLLVAGKNLVGLEPHYMKAGVKEPPLVRYFNQRFEILSQTITDVVDRLTDFEAGKLATLLRDFDSASGIMCLLFSSTEATRNSSIELLKVINGQDARRDALQQILAQHYLFAAQGISNSCRQVMKNKTFAPAASLVKTCSDIIDVMCNSQDGLLRSRKMGPGEAGVTMKLWKNLWDVLTMIFRTTEDWAVLRPELKEAMMDFCRDTMSFAEQLFDQCSILSTALNNTMADTEDTSGSSTLLRELLETPARIMEDMARWLRLRDEFLSGKAVALISKLLVRLQRNSIEITDGATDYIQRVLKKQVRVMLKDTQMAELQRALEIYLGYSLTKEEEQFPRFKQETLSKYTAPGTGLSDTQTRSSSVGSRIIAEATKGASAFQARREAMRIQKEAATKKVPDAKKLAEQAEFKKKRQAEKERQEKERAAAIARAKQSRGLSALTAEAGSGLEGLGILGKEQAAKGEGIMQSDDESEEDDDWDTELFGPQQGKKLKSGPKTNIVDEIKIQQPVKKRKVVRSVKDLRARLTPDMSALHKTILSWNYYHQSDWPPNDRADRYSAVSNTFRTPNEYQSVFEALLTLEAWQQMVKAREENQSKPYEIKVVSRASVDQFQEVGSTMTHQENRDLGISEGDIVLLSQSNMPSPEDRTCLARVFRVQRKQAHLEVSYRVMPGNPLQSGLVPNGMVYGSKIQSITPLEREYAALVGLQYYDLCDEIIRARPSPLLKYKDSQLDPLIENYALNKAQAKAIKSAVDNDAFTLIQGPPGSGKTKTIVAIVGAILTSTLQRKGTSIPNPGAAHGDSTAKKLLVCAPSNAAVDELVMRFKNGVTTMNGQQRQLNIVRLGRSDAINANVQDVTLEEKVNQKLGVNSTSGEDRQATQKIFDEHKKVSGQLRNARDQMDSGEVKGPDQSKLQDEINVLKRQKALLGARIDQAKDSEKVASRNADINRRRAQEQVLREADVICATLSGSGHDMFQNLSVEFETVIVDEAAQCVEMSALIPLKYGCQKCILVGDPKQLPPTVFSKEAARFQYEQSLFVRMQKNHPDDVHLLDTQYRMHPDISYFPSQTFYDGRLLDGPDMAKLRKQPWHASSLLAPFKFYDVQGQHSAAPKGHSLINIAEINVALQLYRRLTQDYGEKINFRGKIGIITPYKSQLRELKTRFSKEYGQNILEDVDFNTTDAFQGRESEVIIFSCVRASPAGGIGFLDDIRRMNVGLTRAKSSLWVLGNSASLMRGQFWRLLVEDARKRGRYLDGNIQGMLKKHSNAFPAPKDQKYEIRERQVDIKQERASSHSMSRSSSDQSSELNYKPKKEEDMGIKTEIKPEIKREAQDVKPISNGKRKLSEDRSESDHDVEMEDAFSDPSVKSRTGSGRSTPATASGTTTPVPADLKAPGAVPAPNKNDVVGTMAMSKPKIRRRPREVDPFIKRQPTKKPRTG